MFGVPLENSVTISMLLLGGAWFALFGGGGVGVCRLHTV